MSAFAAPEDEPVQAARVLLQAISGDRTARGRVGFKPSGGIRTVADAALVLQAIAGYDRRDAA